MTNDHQQDPFAMKIFQLTIPLIIGIVVGLLYLLQSCGGVHYDSYVADYKDIAMKEMQRTGYPASIKLAQAILESQGGRGKLAFEYNNHFGIPCGKNWPGQKYYQEEEDYYTGETLEICYRVYNSPTASFVAHTDLIKKEFRTLFHKMDPMDYVAWAKKLARMQYSDSETYDATLINMIKRYKLYEFDQLAMGLDASPITQEVATSNREDDYYEDDYYADKEVATYEDRIEQRVDKYREGLEELDDNITYHRRKYPAKNTRQKEYRDRYEADYVEEDAYYNQPDRTSNSRRTYEEDAWEEDIPATYDRDDWSDRNRYTQDTRRTTSRFNTTDVDAKYEGFSTPPASRHRPSRTYDYSQPSYRKTKPTPSYEEEYWDMNEVEATRISDFRDAEDFAYINGVKVATARYDDTPLMIAKRFNVSVKDIIQFNESIKSTKQLLREDQRVYLESKKSYYDGTRNHHIVQFGERMKDIADMYGLSLSALYDKNKMPAGSEPALGERIKLNKGRIKKRPELRYKAPKPLSQANIPNSSIPAATPITDNYPNRVTADQEVAITTVLLQPVTTGKVFHTVREGETLYRIANMYGTTINDLKNMNHLSETTIRRGMRLKVR